MEIVLGPYWPKVMLARIDMRSCTRTMRGITESAGVLNGN